MARAAIHDLDALRRYLGQEAPFLGARSGRQTGIDALDHLLMRGGHPDQLGGLPRGAITIIGGAPGSGRARLTAQILARETEVGRPVAWIDVRGTLYPPALIQAGIALERLLIVRSEPERAIYAAERILESGAFRMVAMSGLERHLSPSRARRLQTAAEAEGATGLVLVDPAVTPKITAAALDLRLTRRGRGIMVEIERDRLGPSGRKAFVPLEGESPWLSTAA